MGECARCYRAVRRLQTLTAQLQHAIKRCLAEISYRSAQFPLATLSICILVSATCGIGLTKLESSVNGGGLWTDQDSDAMRNSEYVGEHFGGAPVTMRLLIQAKSRGENAATVESFREAFDVADIVLAQRSSEGYAFDDLCKLNQGDECKGYGALRFFHSDRATFESMVSSEEDLQEQVSRTTFPDDGEKVIRSEIFGSWTEQDGQVTSAPVFRLDFTLDIGVDGDLWEKAVLGAFVSPETFLVEQRWEHIHVEIWSLGRSVDDELMRTLEGDVIFVGVAFVFLLLVCCLTLGHPFRCIQGRKVLGAGDFFIVGLAILAGYGLASGFGVYFTSLQQILPFILFGIGVDDAYVIAGAFDRTDQSKSAEERVRDAIMHEGMSVTLTSFTDMLAFLCGATAAFPAVSYFCIYAGLSVFFIYCFHITAFCALLAADARRQEAHRLDILCCIKIAPKGESPQPIAESGMVRYTRLITSHIIIKLAIIAAFLSFTAVCLWQAVEKTDTRLNLVDLAPDQSYMRDFIEAEYKYWGGDSSGLNLPVYLHFRGIEESDGEIQARMWAAEEELLQLSAINAAEGIRSWHRSFTDWAWSNRDRHPLLDGNNFASIDGRSYLVGPSFYTALEAWIHNCSLGCSFESDVLWDSTGISDSRVMFIQVSTSDSDRLGDFLTEVEDFIARKEAALPGTFVYNEIYIFYDSYRSIRSELYQTTGLCLLAVLVVSLAVISHPGAALIIVGVVFIVFVDLLGCLPMWGISLNSISMINLVMAIGFVVDYSMHIAHSFMSQNPELSRNERVGLAMKDIGFSVFKGVVSTLVAILPLAVASSEVFRIFFRLNLSIMVVGGAHGLIFMPVVLSLIGPRGWVSDHGRVNPGRIEEKEAVEEATVT